jgi:hypothetical protein
VQDNTLVVSAAMKEPNADASWRSPKTRRFGVVPMDGELREWIALSGRDAIGAALLFPNANGKKPLDGRRGALEGVAPGGGKAGVRCAM